MHWRYITLKRNLSYPSIHFSKQHYNIQFIKCVYFNIRTKKYTYKSLKKKAVKAHRSWYSIRIASISRQRGLLLFSAAGSVNVIGQVSQNEFNDGRKRGLLYNSRYFFLSFSPCFASSVRPLVLSSLSVTAKS